MVAAFQRERYAELEMDRRLFLTLRVNSVSALDSRCFLSIHISTALQWPLSINGEMPCRIFFKDYKVIILTVRKDGLRLLKNVDNIFLTYSIVVSEAEQWFHLIQLTRTPSSINKYLPSQKIVLLTCVTTILIIFVGKLYFLAPSAIYIENYQQPWLVQNNSAKVH